MFVRQLVRNLLEGLKGLEDDDVVTCIFIENEVNVAKLLCTVYVVFIFGIQSGTLHPLNPESFCATS